MPRYCSQRHQTWQPAPGSGRRPQDCRLRGGFTFCSKSSLCCQQLNDYPQQVCEQLDLFAKDDSITTSQVILIFMNQVELGFHHRAPLPFSRQRWQMVGNSSPGSRLMSGRGSVYHLGAKTVKLKVDFQWGDSVQLHNGGVPL